MSWMHYLRDRNQCFKKIFGLKNQGNGAVFSSWIRHTVTREIFLRGGQNQEFGCENTEWELPINVQVKMLSVYLDVKVKFRDESAILNGFCVTEL